MSKPKELKAGMSQLLAEGADAKNFCIWACVEYGFEHIEVQDFGGIEELDNFLEMIKVVSNYDKVPAILIVRDAETNPEGAIKSVKTSLKKNNFVVPPEPYSYHPGNPGIEFAILPGKNSSGEYCSGALENLCMSTVETDPLWNNVDEFLKIVQQRGEKLTHLHKSRLYSYLAVKNKFVGMKIGEAAKAGAWNWEHEALSQLKQAMRDVEQAACLAMKNLS